MYCNVACASANGNGLVLYSSTRSNSSRVVDSIWLENHTQSVNFLLMETIMDVNPGRDAGEIFACFCI
jgi:hypothetical protein